MFTGTLGGIRSFFHLLSVDSRKAWFGPGLEVGTEGVLYTDFKVVSKLLYSAMKARSEFLSYDSSKQIKFICNGYYI